MNRKVKRIIEITIFVILLLFSLDRVSLAVNSYCYEDKPRSSALFYELPKNTVDFLMVGNSHIYCSYIPKMIFDEIGVTSAILGSGNQSIINSYWLTKEAFVKQKPKVVMIDVHSIESSIRKNDDVGSITSGLSLLPNYSINKYFAYYNVKNSHFESSEDVVIDDVIALLKENDDFGRNDSSLIKLLDFVINPAKYYSTFGFDPKYAVYINDKIQEGVYNSKIDFYQTEEFEYLEKLKELCDKNNAKLIVSRSLYNSDTVDMNVVDSIFEWANKNDVEIFDLFDYIETMGIDLSTDFKDESHLNYWGAKKATKQLMTFLNDNYELEDHRNDVKYKLWQNNDYDYSLIDEAILEELNK